MNLRLDTHDWAQEQFGTCQLGDARRTKRLVKFASQVAANPDGSTPDQTAVWKDLKAAYRLIDGDTVHFDSIARPHWEMTKDQPSGDYLLSCDTTEVNFGWDNNASGLGPLGKGETGRGFLLHSGLLVRADTEEALGLAGQQIRYRKPAPAGETSAQRLKRDRESLVWGELIDDIGPPKEGCRFIDLCDRGADNFEVYCKCLLNRHDWVVRGARLNRKIKYLGEEMAVSKCLDQLPLAGTYRLSYRTTNQGNRTANIEVRYGTIAMPAPRQTSPWLKELGINYITMNLVLVREVKPPKGVKRLQWVLYTSLPVTSFSRAWKVIEYYEKRPIIEEFHKALKTGCRVQDRQYETDKRLEAITGLLSVTAMRLLLLRSAARTAPDSPVEKAVPKRWVTMLSCFRDRKIKTLREFYRQLAGLGGHMLRKGDGEPGWITLWRGFEKLCMAVQAVRKYGNFCG